MARVAGQGTPLQRPAFNSWSHGPRDRVCFTLDADADREADSDTRREPPVSEQLLCFLDSATKHKKVNPLS